MLTCICRRSCLAGSRALTKPSSTDHNCT
jgi:hypothetical protein